MKKAFIFFSAILVVSAAFSQSFPYVFTPLKDNDKVSVEDQCATGTCWSFATASFIESEIIRKGHPAVDLSEMYNVRVTYPAKAESYVRYQGKQQFGPGGLGHDVVNVVRDYGIVPEAAYTGLASGQSRHDHGGLDAVLESTVKTVIDKKLNEENNEWMDGVNGILDSYIGPAPATFEYLGKKYTPSSFRDDMGINANDYISLTSFSHHPFYAPFVLEVPDNWAKGSFYNLPLNDLMRVMDTAIDKGYTIAWDADVSEKGFSFRNGIAIVPADSVKKEQVFSYIVKEKTITQENRQAAFDSFQTTDDHLMHITGKAKDQNGNVYFITKNSWGTNNAFNGYQYVSKPYVEYKTVSIVVHKDAIPADIRKSLGI